MSAKLSLELITDREQYRMRFHDVGVQNPVLWSTLSAIRGLESIGGISVLEIGATPDVNDGNFSSYFIPKGANYESVVLGGPSQESPYIHQVGNFTNITTGQHDIIIAHGVFEYGGIGRKSGADIGSSRKSFDKTKYAEKLADLVYGGGYIILTTFRNQCIFTEDDYAKAGLTLIGKVPHIIFNAGEVILLQKNL